MTTTTRKTAARKALPRGNAPATVHVDEADQPALTPDELIAIGAATGDTPAKTATATGTTATADGTPIMSVLTIVFRGRVCPVEPPNTGQTTLLVDAERWMVRAQRDMQQLGSLDGLPETDPKVVKAMGVAKRGMEHVGRMARIMETLFQDPDDWDWICDMLAGKEIDWREVAEIPALVIRAQNEAQGPTNRAERRATTRGHRAR